MRAADFMSQRVARLWIGPAPTLTKATLVPQQRAARHQRNRKRDCLRARRSRQRQLEGPRRRGHEDELRDLAEELVEAERAVVEGRRKPEAVVDERLLARAVALVHASELRHGLVRLVDEDDEIVGEVVDERERVRAGRPPSRTLE